MSAAGAGLRTEGGPDPKKRALAAVLVLLAVIAVAILLFRGDGGYRVTAEFVNAGQLVKGNEVKAGGVAVGSVKDIDVTQDGTRGGHARASPTTTTSRCGAARR